MSEWKTVGAVVLYPPKFPASASAYTNYRASMLLAQLFGRWPSVN